jgi:YesN/AraC family two-component response regulator
LLIIAAFSYCIIPIILLIFPEILYGLPRTTSHLQKNEPYESIPIVEINPNKNESFLDIDPLKSIADKITLYINNDKPYLNENFNIDDIAEKIDIPKHHVYYCFSNIINKKFTKLRTELRVEYAKKLLLSEEINSSSLEGIWSKSGFSSKTSFFTSFKEETGLTPKEYIIKNK